MKEGDLETSLISVLGDAGGKDLLQDAGELALDAILTDGILKEAPVVGTLAKLYKMAVGAQGYIFAKKVKRFLCEIGKIPKKDRDGFAKKLNSDRELASDTAEVLLCLLDKLDVLEKAEMLARAFSGYVYGDYDEFAFRRLALAVDRCFIGDLTQLKRLEKPTELEAYIGDILVGAGLAQVESIPQIKWENWRAKYVITSLGELFHLVVMEGKRYGS